MPCPSDFSHYYCITVGPWLGLYNHAAAFAYAIWRFLRRFTRRNVIENIPGPQSSSFWTGSFFDLFNLQAWDFHQAIAQKYGSIIKINTMLGGKQLYVFDPKALHHIVIKDQDIFEETAAFISSNNINFGKGLFATLGDHHRKQRKMLYPVFSTTHLKAMVPTFYVVGHKLRAAFMSRLADGPRELDVLLWMSRTALELIGQAGLGHSFDTLIDDEVNSYVKLVKEFMPSLARTAFVRRYVVPWAVNIGTPRFQRFVLRALPWKSLHGICDAVDIMHETSCGIYNSKKLAFEAGDEAVSAQIGQGKDIISILMKANMDASEGEKLPESEVIAQISVLVFAAMDTTSTALSRILFKLAENPDIQEKLRNEVTAARKKAGGDVSHDELVSLPYLDAICRETLRLHPPLTYAIRTATKDVVLPLSKPVTGIDGTTIYEIPIPKNTNVIMSILNANRNPEIWGPDASEFKPERWLQPLPKTLIEAHMPGVYSNMMTFLGGGRSCIGFKFSQLEIKVVLSLLLETFRFSLPEKEIIWQMSGVVAPIVKDSTSRQSAMPLRISLVEPVKY